MWTLLRLWSWGLWLNHNVLIQNNETSIDMVFNHFGGWSPAESYFVSVKNGKYGILKLIIVL